jgi:hypothetical protein
MTARRPAHPPGAEPDQAVRPAQRHLADRWLTRAEPAERADAAYGLQHQQNRTSVSRCRPFTWAAQIICYLDRL